MKATSKWTKEIIDLPMVDDWDYSYNEHSDETQIMLGDYILVTLSGESDEETCEEIVEQNWILEDHEEEI